MNSLERQHDEQSILFFNLERLIEDVKTKGYENVQLIGGQNKGLLAIANDFLSKDKLTSAKSYYWRIVLDGYKFFTIYNNHKKNNVFPESGEFSDIKRNMNYVIKAENKLVQIIFEGGATPDNEKVWSRLEYILSQGVELCEEFQPEARPKKINNLSIIRTSSALHISEKNPFQTVSILSAQIKSLSDVYEKFVVDPKDPDSVSQPADHLNNLGSMYLLIANQVLIDKLYGTKKIPPNISFLDNLIKAQESFHKSINILTNSEFEDYHKYKLKKATAVSNLAFTYILLGHFYLEEGGSIEKIIECASAFRDNFQSADGVFLMLQASSLDVSHFDAEIHRRTADILILLLYTRAYQGDDLTIEYTKTEFDILRPILTDSDYLEYRFSANEWLTKKINSYINFSLEQTIDHDDKVLLLQTAQRLKAIL